MSRPLSTTTRPLFVGSDVGSQSVKANLFDVSSTCLAESAAEIPIHRFSAEHVEQDPDDFYRAVNTTIADCVSKSAQSPADVAGVAVAGQMAGILGIDVTGQAVTPLRPLARLTVSPGAETHRQPLKGRNGSPYRLSSHGGPCPEGGWPHRNEPAAYAPVAKFVCRRPATSQQLAGGGEA